MYLEPYPGYSLAMSYACQTIPWVQFGYNAPMPNQTLGNVNTRYGLVVTSVQLLLRQLPFLKLYSVKTIYHICTLMVHDVSLFFFYYYNRRDKP